VIECEACDRPFDPVAHRYLCPWCKTKTTCCDGAPLPTAPVPEPRFSTDDVPRHFADGID
jgi:hypothetical protein